MFTLIKIFISLCNFELLSSVLSFYPAWTSSSSSASLVVISSLNLCLKMSWFFSSLLRDSFARFGFLVDNFFLLALWIYWPTVFWTQKFMRTLLIVLLRTSFMWWLASLLLLSRFSLSFTRVIIIYLSVGLFDFTLPGVRGASWMFIFMSFNKFGKFSAIISSNIFSDPFSLLLGLSQCVCWSPLTLFNFLWSILFVPQIQ